MKDSPRFTDAYYTARKQDLAIMEAFKKGKKGVKPLLQKWERETEKGYQARQEASTVFNQTKRTIQTINSMIFRKDISYKDLNKIFLSRIEDIDGCDTNLNDFAKDLQESGTWDGVSYILVDMPQNDQPITTLAEQISRGIVPYFTKVKSSQILNRRIENNVLRQITIAEQTTIYEGRFKEKKVDQQRVLFIGGGEIWRNDELIYSWTNNLPYIPLVPYYTNKEGYFDASPKYLDLAELNLKHFNYQSQLDKTLFIASNPIPKIWGEYSKDMTIGVDQAMVWSHKDAGGFEWEEFKGTSVDKLQEEIKNIEGRMFTMGLSAITDKEQTATEALIANAGETSDLSSMASALSGSLNLAYAYFCDMMKIQPTGDITVNKDFNGIALSTDRAKQYLEMYKEGTITLAQFWDEMEAGEFLQPFDRDLAKAELEAGNQDIGIG